MADILYEVRGKIAIITLNQPTKLNALNGEQYLQLGLLMEKANKNPDTVITLLQSTGRYFSAGANVASLRPAKVENPEQYWLDNFVSRNTFLTSTFVNHNKVLVCALNGSAIGLSAALVGLCDIVYANSEKLFLLVPFANLGLVSEGSASVSLFKRLGWSTANEALLFSRPIKGKVLLERGLINKVYNAPTTEEFNAQVLADVTNYYENLHHDSILDIKKLIKHNYVNDIEEANSKEVIGGYAKWLEGVPQERFRKMATKSMKHKL